MKTCYKRKEFICSDYLESWTAEDGRISVYNKISGKLYKTEEPKVFTNKNYVKTMSHDELSEIFSCLRGLEVSVLLGTMEKRLSGVHEYAHYYCDFEKWIIRSVEGKVIRKQRINDQLQSGIEAIRAKWFIREWSGWTDYISKINDKIDAGNKVSEKEIDKMKSIILSQILNDNKSIIRIERLFGLEDVEIDSKWLEKKLKHLHIVFIRPVGRRFITSDSPVMVVSDGNFLRGKYNGIYMPVLPDLMIALYAGATETYSIASFDNNLVRRFNKRLGENAENYYIK